MPKDLKSKFDVVTGRIIKTAPRYLYRYVDTSTLEWHRIVLMRYQVVKETPCGYWIEIQSNAILSAEDSFQNKKWVSRNAFKRFAYPDKESAWNNFVARKRRQLELVEAKAKALRRILLNAERLKKEDISEYFRGSGAPFGAGFWLVEDLKGSEESRRVR